MSITNTVSIEQGNAARKRSSREYLLASFFIPFLIMGIMYILNGVYPFGDGQIMRHDMYYQYYPFLRELKTKLAEGTSFLWSWNIGMGTNFIGLYTYYLASPLNFLLVLSPVAYLREAVTLVVLIRIGLAGLFCAIMLKGAFGRSDWTLTIFSSMYALCGFILGYYTNTPWLDSFALLPLVMLGVLRLLREKKFILYTLSLFLSIWCNFLIGLYICIFTAIVFVALCVIDRVSLREFLGRLLRIALFSAIGIGMTALLTLPTYAALQNVHRTLGALPTHREWYADFASIVGNFSVMTEPTSLKGLPNMYSGLLPVMLIGAFLSAKKISIREKIVYVIVIILLMVSGNYSLLYYGWNAFTPTFSYPFRFSFLLSFVLVAGGYRAFILMRRPRLVDLLCMAVPALLVIACAFIGPQSLRAVLVTALFMAIYLAIMLLYRQKKLKRSRYLAALLVAVIAELALSAFISTQFVSVSIHSIYPYEDENMQAVLTEVRARETDPNAFYRMEVDRASAVHNDPALSNYHGVSSFASVVNAGVSGFLQDVGIDASPSGNIYTYTETTPLTNAFLNVKYYISRLRDIGDDAVYWTRITQKGNVSLLENNAYLPLGFMVDSHAMDYRPDSTDPFIAQNELFNKATGLEGALFMPVDGIRLTNQNLETSDLGGGNHQFAALTEEQSTLRWIFNAPEDGLYYMYLNVPGAKFVNIVSNAENRDFPAMKPFLTPLGEHSKGDKISLSVPLIKEEAEVAGTATLWVYRIDEDLFARGYALLEDEPMVITDFGDTSVSATIKAKQDGLLYTSIPYEEGWRAYVDGEAVDVTPFDDAMLAVPLSEGTHTLYFTYYPVGLTAGMIASAAALALLICCVLLDRHRRKTAPTR